MTMLLITKIYYFYYYLINRIFKVVIKKQLKQLKKINSNSYDLNDLGLLISLQTLLMQLIA